MDTLTQKHASTSISSGCSTESSATNINSSRKSTRDSKASGGNCSTTSRSRSFLYCISKHLGRHFMHNPRRHQDNMHNNREDIRSSSTDSISLSSGRASLPKSLGGGSIQVASSSIDLTTISGDYTYHNSCTSSASPYSRFSPALYPLDAETVDEDEAANGDYNHIYIDTLYRPHSVMDRHCDFSTSEGDEDDVDEDDDNENDDVSEYGGQNATEKNCKPAASRASVVGSTRRYGKSGSLHLSRISISSSVSRMLHNLSGNSSTRSLSCSSTPLRCFNETNIQRKVHKSSSTKPSPDTPPKASPAPSSSTSSSASAKKEKKQQSILRPPMPYVYKKGMSGLYSRVPRYTVCCPYGLHQF